MMLQPVFLQWLVFSLLCIGTVSGAHAQQLPASPMDTPADMMTTQEALPDALMPNPNAIDQELLDLPTFDSNADAQADNAGPVSLQLLTRDELKALYSNNIPMPEAPRRGKPTASVPSLSLEPAPSTSGQSAPATDSATITTPGDVPALSGDGTPLPSDSTEVVAVQENSDALASGWKGGSMMFSDDDLLQLQIALAKYYRSRQEAMLRGQVTESDTKTEKRQSLYPVIFAGTIMYVSPTHWSAWINGKKFAPNLPSPLDGIKVTRASRDQVILEWTPDVYIKAAPKNPAIRKLEDNVYEITMKPNQVLVTQNLTLEEGRLLSRNVIGALRARKEKELNKSADDVSLEELGINPDNPVDRDKMNMDKLINQYRQADGTLKGAPPANESSPQPAAPPTTQPVAGTAPRH